MTPRHRRRTLGSAHRRSLRRQGQWNRSALATPPRFAPRQRKHSIKWLLKQTQFFLPDISTTNTADHHPNDKPQSSILHKQIDSYLFETALILDAALRDFEHDRDQQNLQEQANNHNNDANATDNQSDEPPDTDPSLLH